MEPVSDVSRSLMVIISMIITTVIGVMLTLLRLYVRIRMIKFVAWDDVFNVLAMVSLPDRVAFIPRCPLC
jgi:hypothetical protein